MSVTEIESKIVKLVLYKHFFQMKWNENAFVIALARWRQLLLHPIRALKILDNPSATATATALAFASAAPTYFISACAKFCYFLFHFSWLLSIENIIFLVPVFYLLCKTKAFLPSSPDSTRSCVHIIYCSYDTYACCTCLQKKTAQCTKCCKR